MLSMTPGTRSGRSAAVPTQAIRPSLVSMEALLSISEPVHNRPILVSRRTVTAGNPTSDEPSMATQCATQHIDQDTVLHPNHRRQAFRRFTPHALFASFVDQ